MQRTQRNIHEKRILRTLVKAPNGEMRSRDMLSVMREEYLDQLNETDLRVYDDGREYWATRVASTRRFMIKDGLLEDLEKGKWRLTSSGKAAALIVDPDPELNHDPETEFVQTYGEIEGFPPGSVFKDRQAAYDSGIHRTTQAGIADPDTGVYSVCMSSGYGNDSFNGDLITYTGAGGIDRSTKRHIADQTLTKLNLGLVRNHENGQPVRVLARKSVISGNSADSDYVYLGLFDVVSWGWSKADGFKVLVYQLQAADLGNVGIQEAFVPELSESESHPGRKIVSVNRIIRDPKVKESVKKIYDNQCQICKTRLVTAAGPYSEGAHIRPLGAPHNGPDSLSNMLCLCPNCHTIFDGRALWIDFQGTIHGLSGYLGKIHIDPKHSIDFAQFAYQRELCGFSAE